MRVAMILGLALMLTSLGGALAEPGCRCNIRGEISCDLPQRCRQLGGTCNGNWPLPGGSYIQSCQSCFDDCTFLNCNCRRINGSYNPTRAIVETCPSTRFRNNDGNLVCQ
jgi:hypothetical protein